MFQDTQLLEQEIRRGHCIDLLPGVEKLDLVVTDPPYAFTGSGPEHEMTATVAIALRECANRMAKGSWMIVFCASSWRSVNYTIEAVRGIMDPVRFGTWVKPNPRSRVIIPGWKWSTVNVVAMRKGNKNRPEVKPSEILDHISAAPIYNGRRAQLPDEVCDWAIAPFAIPGGVFLDPFAGSGALVRSAHRHGMNALGFELQET